jgi:putative hydrolase of the HAD superfamily
MIKAVLFDIGGTLHEVKKDPGSEEKFAALLMEKLSAAGIVLPVTPAELSKLLYKNSEEYKHHSEEIRKELPSPVIWNEYYLKDFHIGTEKLAPVAEELSCLYDSVRVRNVVRPHMKETMERLSRDGMKLGIISNIISRNFVPDMLKKYGIFGMMSCIILSSEVTVRKPDAEIFRIASEKIGIPLNEIAYVGDTLSRDVLGCRNAKTGYCIQIRNPSIAHRDTAFVNTGLKPDVLISDLAEIPDLIAAFNKASS